MGGTVTGIMQENQEFVRPVARTRTQSTSAFKGSGEVVRKSLHFLIAVVPVLACVNLPATLALLATGTLFYAFAESSRRLGNPILVVSDLTMIASRDGTRTDSCSAP